MKILILATAKTSKAVKRIEYEAKKRGHTVLVVNPMNMSLKISSSESGFDTIYVHDRKGVRRLNVKDIDAIIVRIGDHVSYGAFILNHLHENMQVFATNSAEGIRNASNQLKSLQLLSSHGLPVPKTAYTQNPAHIDRMIDQIGSWPIVCKQTFGSGGSGVSLLKDRQTAVPILQSLYKAKASFVLQEFLPANGKDYRAIVIGDQVVACMERSAKKGDFRANLKQAGHGRAFHLSDEDKKIAVRACKAVGLYSAGVDLMMANNRTYVIECNANWGWDSEHISKINYTEILIKFCEQNYQKLIPVKRKTLNYEKLLGEQKKLNNELSEIILKSNGRYRELINDQYLKEIFKKANGHNVSYRNRENQKCEIRVENIQDLFQIMKDTFVLK